MIGSSERAALRCPKLDAEQNDIDRPDRARIVGGVAPSADGAAPCALSIGETVRAHRRKMRAAGNEVTSAPPCASRAPK